MLRSTRVATATLVAAPARKLCMLAGVGHWVWVGWDGMGWDGVGCNMDCLSGSGQDSAPFRVVQGQMLSASNR